MTKKLAMLQQKNFEEEESKSDNDSSLRMGARMGQ